MVGPAPHRQHGIISIPAKWFTVVVWDASVAPQDTGWDAVAALLRTVDRRFATERIRSGVRSGATLLGTVAEPARSVSASQMPPPDRRLLAVEADFARTLAAADPFVSPLRDTLSRLFDTEPVPPSSATHNQPMLDHHCALIGHISVNALRRRARTVLTGRLGSRLLFIGAQPDVGRMPSAGSPDRPPDPSSDLRGALAHAATVGRVAFTPDAAELWAYLYRSMETRPLPEEIAGLTRRAPVQTLRIALLITLLRRGRAVSAADLAAAADMVRYGVDTALYVFAAADGRAPTGR